MKKILVMLAVLFTVGNTWSQDMDSVSQMSLEDLISFYQSSEIASGIDESNFETPAPTVVITSQDIADRGYTSLHEIFTDLPGFDVTIANSVDYMMVYQRGYRTPFMQRTLFMVNGKVMNDLWRHSAQISRQFSVQNIERVEVLYGPVSALYGPNAFLGIINVITQDGSDLENKEMQVNVNAEMGSYNTKALDMTFQGKMDNEIRYSFNTRTFTSDEADLNGQVPFSSNAMLSNPDYWGPLLDHSSRNIPYGSYQDPSDNSSFVAEVGYKGLSVGMINYRIREGYGAGYAADQVQTNGDWGYKHKNYYVDYEGDYGDKWSYLLSYQHRENNVIGDWAEATIDWNDDRYSYISQSFWHSDNESNRYKANLNYQANENLRLSTGILHERKQLTKAYDISGYWNQYSSVAKDTGAYGFGEAIAHSTDPLYQVPRTGATEMPSNNLAFTKDFGTFVQAIYDLGNFRLNGGVRYDYNSIYKDVINPRASVIYKLKKDGAIKLIYGEAFQEPAPISLWGGWSGRLANPNLKPEKARNLELGFMKQTGFLFHDVSLYRGMYENVIKEEAENAGSRTVNGLEYKLQGKLKHFNSDLRPITMYGYYSFTQSQASISYNHTLGEWEDVSGAVGDIAPHKVQIGVNYPINKHLNFNLRSVFVSDRKVYSRNALNANPDYVLDGYMLMNATLNFNYEFLTLTLRGNNLLDEAYLHPGFESASAGIDQSNRSRGFQNSLLPQVGRNFSVIMKCEF